MPAPGALPCGIVSDSNRRIDRVQDDDFLTGLDGLSDSEVRDRRAMCDDLDLEFSYYRRMLHGRLDLVAFEMRRRAGEEEQSLIEALPRILAEGAYTSSPGLSVRKVPVEVPDIPRHGRRIVDRALDDDFIVRLSSLDDTELGEIQRFIQEVEAEVSRQRRIVHNALASLQDELARRYRKGSADHDELLASG